MIRATAVKMAMQIPEDVLKRFWAKVNKNGAVCIHKELGNLGNCWLRHKNPKVYGCFDFFGKTTSSHVVSWLIANNEIPAAYDVCHHCDTPACVRPSHLFIGTHGENMTDRNKKGRVASGDRNGMRLHPEKHVRGDQHWTRLHPEKVARGDEAVFRKFPEKVVRGDAHHFRKNPEKRLRGEKNPNVKLSDDAVLQIRAEKKAGVSAKELATKHKVSTTQIYHIVSGKSRKDLPL